MSPIARELEVSLLVAQRSLLAQCVDLLGLPFRRGQLRLLPLPFLLSSTLQPASVKLWPFSVGKKRYSAAEVVRHDNF